MTNTEIETLVSRLVEEIRQAIRRKGTYKEPYAEAKQRLVEPACRAAGLSNAEIYDVEQRVEKAYAERSATEAGSLKLTPEAKGLASGRFRPRSKIEYRLGEEIREDLNEQIHGTGELPEKAG